MAVHACKVLCQKQVRCDGVTEISNTKAFQEAIFIFSVAAAVQWIHIQRLSPENKGGSPYIHSQAGSRRKKQGLTHIWLQVPLLATSPPVLWIFLTFTFFKFYLPAVPSLPSCYIIRTQMCLYLFWSSSLLHYSPLWCSAPPTIREHHPDLGVCIFIASLHGQLFFSL
jgi:hypothetical protein